MKRYANIVRLSGRAIRAYADRRGTWREPTEGLSHFDSNDRATIRRFTEAGRRTAELARIQGV